MITPRALGWLIAGAAWLLLVYAWWTSRVRATRRKRLLCPLTGRSVDVVLLRDRRTGRWVDVRRCSIVTQEHPCPRTCLDVLNDSAADIEAPPDRLNDEFDAS